MFFIKLDLVVVRPHTPDRRKCIRVQLILVYVCAHENEPAADSKRQMTNTTLKTLSEQQTLQ
jgi:hypothetical protein